MFLQKLEIQGFKTFAKKTVLSFPGPKGKTNALTAIVGPNGSGKSNAADAIRWALGEQSLKMLRGKDAEDVIFAGAEGKARAGFAEVSLSFNNEDRSLPVDFAEVTITRRLYRDGTSEYLLNNTARRLSDLQLLLAEGNVGQRSYSVVGQGHVDHILVASPEERKAFFDDATGVKQFQIKRHSAVLKLKRTYENLEEVELILREIEPRLRTLKRAITRLEQRQEVEKELQTLQWNYYGRLWSELMTSAKAIRLDFEALNKQVTNERARLEGLEDKLETIAKAEVSTKDEFTSGGGELQNKYRLLQRQRSTLRDHEFAAQKEIELAKVRAQSSWAPLPLPQIIDEIKTLLAEKSLTNLYALAKTLLKKLERPAPEEIKADKTLLKKLDDVRREISVKEKALKDLESEIDRQAAVSKNERTELFTIQKDLREKQSALYAVEQKRNHAQIELARLEERQANLSKEIDVELKDRSSTLKSSSFKGGETPPLQILSDTISKLKYKLELIGGIDPESIKEYGETKERFEFLDSQVSDLRSAIKDTEKVIDELDEKIQKQSAKQFKEINKEFQRYFKILFGGGSCSLVQMTAEDEARDLEKMQTAEGAIEAVDQETLESIGERVKMRADAIVGIDINATPPGKRLKALNLLSGGERALTSIALLSAIMATNPSPFVVLDEVDAALDDANTARFAAILEELRTLTQFIVITHNRATMEHADIIYGVTMGNDGVSNLLSVRLEDVTKNGTARR